MNLTPKQIEELKNGQAVHITVGETPCVLIREDLYDEEIDDSPWTEEEMNLLANQAADLIDDDRGERL